MSRKLYNSQETERVGNLRGVARHTLLRMAENMKLLTRKEAHKLTTHELRDFINEKISK